MTSVKFWSWMTVGWEPIIQCWLHVFWHWRLNREERRLRKWRRMIGVGGRDWKHYVRRKPLVVKRRVRKGIPDCLRGLVWQLISGSRDLLLMNQGVYEVHFLSFGCYWHNSYLPNVLWSFLFNAIDMSCTLSIYINCSMDEEQTSMSMRDPDQISLGLWNVVREDQVMKGEQWFVW